jgi:membrane-associated phospholipid phosphatase
MMVGLAGLQRVAAAAHFPSDVLFASAIGFSLAGIYLWFAPERWAERASRIIPLGLRKWVDRRLQWPPN